MSVQLKEPCIRSLSRYYSFKAAVRAQGNHHFALYKPTPSLFRLQNFGPKQLLSTVALRTNSNEDKLSNQNPKQQLQQMTQTPQHQKQQQLELQEQHIRNAWREYQALYNESPMTLDAKKYEEILIQLSSGAERNDNMWTWVTQAFEEAKKLNIKPTSTMYLLTVTAYGRTNQLEKTMSTFVEYKSHNRIRKNAYLRYIRAILQCQGAELEAHHVLKEWRASRLNQPGKKEGSLCLAELVSHCSKTGHLFIAVKAAGEFRQGWKTAEWDKDALERVTRTLWNGYSQLLFEQPFDGWNDRISVQDFVERYIEKSKLEQKKKIWMSDHLITLFDLLNLSHPTLSPTSNTCDQLLAFCASKNNFGGLKYVLNMMQQLQVQPSSHTISLLLRVFGSSLNDYETFSFYNALKNSGKLDLDLYKVFIKVFTDTMDTERAKRVIHDVQKGGHQLDESFAFAMVQHYVKQGQTKQAANWLKKNKYSGNNLDPYALIMESWISQGQWDHCIGEYNLLKKEGLPGVDHNRRIVKALVTAASARGDWTHCHNILTQLDIHFTATTISRIVDTLINLKHSNNHSLVSGKKIIKALQSMEKTLKIHLTAENIGKIITSLGERGDCEDAYSLYRWVRGDNGEDLEWVHSVSKRCFSLPIYQSMIKTAIKNNDTAKLERAWVDVQYRDRFNTDGKPLLTCLKKRTPPVSAYNTLLNGYASRLPHPNLTQIKRVFRKMVEQGLSPDAVTYNILMKAFVGTNHLASANQIFKEMTRSGKLPDSWSLNILLKGWVERKDWASVEKFVQDLKSSNTLNENVDIVTFNLLVQGFLRLDSKHTLQKIMLKRQKKWMAYRQLGKLEQEKRKESGALPSKTVWNIFETTTGYSKETVEHNLHIPKNNTSIQSTAITTTHDDGNNDPFFTILQDLANKQQLEEGKEVDNQKLSIPDKKTVEKPFIRLFNSGKRRLEADDVTYKLFIKAFINDYDYKSAMKVYHCMHHRNV